jgi:hypothetical protein
MSTTPLLQPPPKNGTTTPHHNLDAMSVDVRDEAFDYLSTLVTSCQERGGYTLPDAVRLGSALEALTAERPFATAAPSSSSSSSSSSSYLLTEAAGVHLKHVFGLLQKSQRLGVLTLQEAWTVYNAMTIFFPPPPSSSPPLTPP